MELAFYDVTFRSTPNSVYSKTSVYCRGEYEAISQVKHIHPEAVIISVKKR